MKAHEESKSKNVEHAPAASITTTSISSVHVNDPTTNLPDDELVTLQLKEQNRNSDFAPTLALRKGKVNENNFEESMKSSTPITPIPFGSIEQMFNDKGPPEGTAAHQVLETRSRFNYRNVLVELMYVYITCRPDIGYAITTLSKFSSEPSAFH